MGRRQRPRGRGHRRQLLPMGPQGRTQLHRPPHRCDIASRCPSPRLFLGRHPPFSPRHRRCPPGRFRRNSPGPGFLNAIRPIRLKREAF